MAKSNLTALLIILLTGSVVAQSPQLVDSAQFNWADQYRYFDEPVDAERYLIRPGEKIQVTFINTRLVPLTLTVDPEGWIVNSTLGVFDLSRCTLAQARTLLEPVIAKLYQAERICISVQEPRRVAIAVSGAVLTPGLYKAYTSQRVSEVIEAAGGVLTHGSHRLIVLSGGPTDITVDLDRASFLGDQSDNPCLYAGSRVYVPVKSADCVQVVGEVNRPREIELRPEDDLSILLAMAGGLTSAANADSIQIIGPSGSRHAQSGRFAAGDIIMVPLRSDTVQLVTIFGAVNAPGRYHLSPAMTVGSLIEKAGGMTGKSSPGQTTLFRRSPADALGRAVEWRYPITSAPAGDQGIASMTLEASDSVYVPYAVGFVKVAGEVLNPGLFPYVSGKTVLDYISAAGGFLPGADQGRIDMFNRVAGVTATISPQGLVQEGNELIVRPAQETK